MCILVGKTAGWLGIKGTKMNSNVTDNNYCCTSLFTFDTHNTALFCVHLRLFNSDVPISILIRGHEGREMFGCSAVRVNYCSDTPKYRVLRRFERKCDVLRVHTTCHSFSTLFHASSKSRTIIARRIIAGFG